MNDKPMECPWCHVYGLHTLISPAPYRWDSDELILSEEPFVYCCVYCKDFFVKVMADIVYPQIPVGPTYSQNMPKECIADYEEARRVFNTSPRASAALLRIVIEKLCRFIGNPNHSLNKNIELLEKKGLEPKVVTALHTLRVIGNEAVHPGILDLHDNKQVAERLFSVTNYITNQLITLPKEAEEIMSMVPEEVQVKINRDKK